MQVLIDRNDLLKALQRAKSVVERKTTVPILSNVLLEASSGNLLTLSSTDLELAVIESVPALEVQQGGSITVPAQMFFDIISRLSEGSTPLLSLVSKQEENHKGEDQEASFVISTGRATFRLSTLPAEDFAVVKKEAHPFSFSLKPTELSDLFEKTKYAISLEETRYFLNGIFLEIGGTDKGVYLRAVATDGHRLAKAETQNISFQTSLPKEKIGLILPYKTVSEVLKIIDLKAQEIIVAFSEKTISFTCGGVHLISRLIDGTFPDYEKVIPVDNPFQLNMSPKIFSQAVDRVAVLASDKTNAIKLTVREDTLILSSSNPHAGAALEEIEVEYKGNSFELGFNARYLLEATKIIKGQEMTIMMRDPASAILINDTADPGFIAVIMPMRV